MLTLGVFLSKTFETDLFFASPQENCTCYPLPMVCARTTVTSHESCIPLYLLKEK